MGYVIANFFAFGGVKCQLSADNSNEIPRVPYDKKSTARFAYHVSGVFQKVSHQPILDFVAGRIEQSDCMDGQWSHHNDIEMALLKACIPLQLNHHGKLIHANGQVESVTAVAQLMKAMRKAKFSLPAREAQKLILKTEYELFKSVMGYRRFAEEMTMLRDAAGTMDRLTAIEVGRFVQTLISSQKRPIGMVMR